MLPGATVEKSASTKASKSNGDILRQKEKMVVLCCIPKQVLETHLGGLFWW